MCFKKYPVKRDKSHVPSWAKRHPASVRVAEGSLSFRADLCSAQTKSYRKLLKRLAEHIEAESMPEVDDLRVSLEEENALFHWDEKTKTWYLYGPARGSGREWKSKTYKAKNKDDATAMACMLLMGFEDILQRA